MPSLYGLGNNTVNVSVTNTTGLYQLNGAAQVLNNAQQLLALLSNNGTVYFQLDPATANTQVEAFSAGGNGTGNYGNTNVATFLGSNSYVTINTQGNITAPYFFGNGAYLTGVGASSNYTNVNVANYLPIYTGNIQAGNITTGNVTQSAYFVGDGSRLYNLNVNVALANIGSNSIVTTGNISAGYFFGNAAYLTGLPATYSNANVNVTGSGNTGSSITTTISNTGVSAGSYGNTGYYPTFTVQADGRISLANSIALPASTQVQGTANQINVSASGSTYTVSLPSAIIAPGSLSVTGNASVGNLTASGNVTALYYFGNGSQLTGLPATYSNANVASYLPTYSGNISAGNITVSGNVSAGYFSGNGSQLTGIVSSYGNANVSAYLSSGTDSANIITTGNVSGTYFLGNGAYLTGINNSLSPGYFLDAYDTTTQSAANASLSYVINISNVGSRNGISVVNSNAISFTYAGTYEIASSFQFLNADNAAHNANVWVRQNGVDQAYSNYNQSLQPRISSGTPSGQLLTFVSTFTANAGDTVQYVWQTDGPNVVTISSEAAGTSPTRPNVPGVQISAFSISNVQSPNGNILLVGNVTGSGLLGSNITTTISNTGVSAGTYGNATYVPQFTVNSDGRISSVTNVAISGGGGNASPGGANTQVQYNSSGTFAGSANLTYNSATGNITLGNNIVVNAVNNNITTNLAINASGSTTTISPGRITFGNGFNGDWSGTTQGSSTASRVAIADLYSRSSGGARSPSLYLGNYVQYTGNITNTGDRATTLFSQAGFGGNISQTNNTLNTLSGILVNAFAGGGPAGNLTALGNISAQYVTGISSTVGISANSTVGNIYGVTATMAATGFNGTGNVTTAIGFSPQWSSSAITPTNYYAFYMPGTLNQYGVVSPTTGGGRAASNYYFLYNGDPVAKTELGSLVHYTMFRPNAYIDANSIMYVSKTSGQTQYLVPNTNVLATNLNSFLTSLTDGAGNVQYQTDTVQLIVSQPSSGGFSITLPNTGNVKYYQGNSSVSTTANSVSVITFTAYDNAGTQNFLIKVDGPYL